MTATTPAHPWQLPRAPDPAAPVASKRLIEVLCPSCVRRCQRRWPVAGDYRHLISRCPRCRLRFRLLDETCWPRRALPDLSSAEWDQQAATHEAAHAVVATVVGLPVLQVEAGPVAVSPNGTWRDQVREASGAVSFADYTVPVGDHLAMVWAGQQAGLRWLRDHGHDTPANRVDVRWLGWGDTAEADRWIRRWALEDCAGQDLADDLVTAHWLAVAAVAERLRHDRRLDGAHVQQLVTTSSQQPIHPTR